MGHRLKVNQQEYQALVVPYAEYLPATIIEAINKLQSVGFPVIFVDGLPDGVSTGKTQLNHECLQVVSLDSLATTLINEEINELSISPADNRLRILHYHGDNEIYMFVNEGKAPYVGKVVVPNNGSCYAYDAYSNQVFPLKANNKRANETEIQINITPGKSQFIIFDQIDTTELSKTFNTSGVREVLLNWQRSQCHAIDYPEFYKQKSVVLPDDLAVEQPSFSGYAAYDTEIEAQANEKINLVITNAAEGVEVFVNHQSLGIQLVAPYEYDLTSKLVDGENTLRIEVATTLERERSQDDNLFEKELMNHQPLSKSGITGKVILYRTK